MHLDITLFGGIPNVAPEILVGVRGPASPLPQALETFCDGHGITNVGGRTLSTPEETNKGKELCTRDRLTAVEFTIARENRFQTPPSVDHDQSISTPPIPRVF